MDQFELAFSTEPVVGWRVWRVLRPIDRKISAAELATELLAAERDGEREPVASLFRYRLRSLTQPVYWPVGAKLESTCELERGGTATHAGGGPHASCECGVWALRTRALALDVLGAYASSGVSVALGKVALWGRLIEHEKGWRGQYAYPLDTRVLHASAEAVRDLAEQYAVPVAILHSADLQETRPGQQAA
jgi:hypothetical protein